jgi:hypothetical protein
VDDPDDTPSSNGCGPGGDDGISDNPAWYACEGQESSFGGSCDTHDADYGTCGSSKIMADINFSNNMGAVCNSLSGDCKDVCQDYADIYVGMVVISGQIYWENAQVGACACCDCN